MHILFRTDGNADIGTGHVMRCLALAQAVLEQGAKATFLCSELTPALAERLSQEGCTVKKLSVSAYGKDDAEETANIDAEWIVVDGYNFDGAYLQHLKDAGKRVLMIDDYGHAKQYSCELVLNQNPYAQKGFYKGSPAELLLGSRYCLLRKEFRKWCGWARETREQPERLLVTLGGADTNNVTCKILSFLSKSEVPVDVTVVIGGSNPNLKEAQEIAKTSRTPMSIVSNVRGMPELMAQCDAALCAGGTTSYELAFLQVPMLTVVLAENQKAVAESLEEHGCSINLGTAEELQEEGVLHAVKSLLSDAAKRASMSAEGAALIDGYGADRTCLRLLDAKLRLRPAVEADAYMLWEWANDPVVRQSSFSVEPIALENHITWFAYALQNPACHILVACNMEDEPVGQIRFNEEGEDAVIDMHISQNHRGKRYASELIAKGTTWLFENTSIHVVHAYIRPENEASVRSFLGAGFTQEGEVEQKGVRVIHCRKTRS